MDERADQQPDSDVLADDLLGRTWNLLQPGEIELDGLVVMTDLENDEEPEMHQLTVQVGETIAKHSGYPPGDTFVYSGTDDSEFASNQHQGLTLDDEEFVWECQQLYRDGSFDVVFYFEASVETDELLSEVRDTVPESFYVRGDADSAADAIYDIE